MKRLLVAFVQADTHAGSRCFFYSCRRDLAVFFKVNRLRSFRIMVSQSLVYAKVAVAHDPLSLMAMMSGLSKVRLQPVMAASPMA